jgi:hypothetical protein
MNLNPKNQPGMKLRPKKSTGNESNIKKTKKRRIVIENQPGMKLTKVEDL